MNGLRQAILGLFGLVVAIAAGLMVLPIAFFLDPVTREAGAALARFAMSSLADPAVAGSPVFAAAELARFIWTIVVAVCVAPLLIAVLTGAAARTRSLYWYAGGTGLIAALAPFVARAALRGAQAFSASPAELRFAFIFFLTGAASGLVYWLIAGRGSRGGPNA